MIVVDSSALIAVLFEEPEKQAFQDIIDGDERCVLSAIECPYSTRDLSANLNKLTAEKRAAQVAELEIVLSA
jgi:uncharacterized protein with PIN domain